MTSETLSRPALNDLAPAGFGFSGVKVALKRLLVNLQISQMGSALYRLDDGQLETMGITRADIPAHARKLVLEDA